ISSSGDCHRLPGGCGRRRTSRWRTPAGVHGSARPAVDTELRSAHRCDSSSVDLSSIQSTILQMVRDADIAVRFGARLRELRQTKGLSQEAFAAACGLDRTYISGIERGKRNVSLRNIEVLANALGMSISVLMKGLVR